MPIRSRTFHIGSLDEREREAVIAEAVAIDRALYRSGQDAIERWTTSLGNQDVQVTHYVDRGRVVAYLMIMTVERVWDGEPMTIVRSRAGALPEVAGRNLTLPTAISFALRYKALHPGRRVFFLNGILTPNAYRLFARICDEIQPHPSRAPLALARGLMELHMKMLGLTNASRRDGIYLYDSGSVWNGRHDPARSDVYSRFFERENPGYRDGTAMVVVIELSLRNLLRGAARVARQRLDRYHTRRPAAT